MFFVDHKIKINKLTLLLILIHFLFSCSRNNDFFIPTPIDNFRLTDHLGISHELFYYNDADVIAIMVHGNGCPIVQNSLVDFLELQRKFNMKNIKLFFINSNLQDNRESIAENANKWKINIPILIDDDQLIGRSLNLKRTAEVLIIDPKKREIVYRGALSDRVHYDGKKDIAENSFAEDALKAFFSGKRIINHHYENQGCLINFPEQKVDTLKNISYVDDVAPILIKKCFHCHNDNGIGPWSMSNFNMIKGFSPMIREVIRLKRMPPWDADPEIGNWSNDFSLTSDEKRILVNWIEMGSPRGGGIDPLENMSPPENTWKKGVPDLILNVPKFDIPANGNLPYRYVQIDNPLDHDVWVTAADVKIGDPKAIHHLYAGFSNPDSIRSNDQRTRDNFLVAWSPGSDLGEMPDGVGVLLGKDDKIFLEMHYVTYGKKSSDITKIGLYFSDSPPEKIMRYTDIRDEYMEIPANVTNFPISSYHVFDYDAHLLMLTPHSHYRGKSSKFTLLYPDGNKEVILSVPDYDYNWQLTYHFDTPKAVPAGSILHYQTVFDNSKFNKNNPDPNKIIYWGEQLENEMHYAPITFLWDDETPDNLIHNPNRVEFARLMGAIDNNTDYFIDKSEVPRILKSLFYKIFFKGDNNRDDKLDHEELMLAIE